MSKIERRYSPGQSVEIIERGEGQLPKITGYAAVFYRADEPGTEFRIYDDVAERIGPDAFTDTLKTADVRGAFNHDMNQILGRSSAGTLRLSVDARGLKYEIDPPNTQAGRDAVELLRRGDVNGSSFAFVPRSTTYERAKDGAVVLVRNKVDLIDVGPVSFPAYTGTEAGVRSIVTENLSEEIELARAATTKPSSGCPYSAVAMARAVQVEMEIAANG